MAAALSAPTRLPSAEPTNLHVMEHASRMNNKGALFLTQGDWNGGLTSLRTSLQSFVAYMRTLEAPAPAAVGVNVGSLTFSAQALGSTPVGALQLPLTREPTSDSVPFLYTRPLVLEATMIVSGIPSQEACLILCAVVTFNMAIATHQRALAAIKVNTDDSNHFAAKALHLYDSSITFFARSSPSDGGKAFAAVMAAALNNKIQIYEMNGQFDEVDRNAANLRQVLSCLSPLPGHDLQGAVTAQILQEGDLEGILLNLLLINRSISANAA